MAGRRHHHWTISWVPVSSLPKIVSETRRSCSETPLPLRNNPENLALPPFQFFLFHARLILFRAGPRHLTRRSLPRFRLRFLQTQRFRVRSQVSAREPSRSGRQYGCQTHRPVESDRPIRYLHDPSEAWHPHKERLLRAGSDEHRFA